MALPGTAASCGAAHVNCTSGSLLNPASPQLLPQFRRDAWLELHPEPSRENGTGFTCDAPGSTFKSTRQVSLSSLPPTSK